MIILLMLNQLTVQPMTVHALGRLDLYVSVFCME